MNSLLLSSHRFLFIFHLAVGLFSVYQPQFLMVVWVDMLLLLILQILFSDTPQEPVLASISYFTGIEVFMRMTNQTFLWEQSKYIVALFAIIGLFRTKQIKLQNLLIPALFLIPLTIGGFYMSHAESFAELRKQFLFDMSGPIALTILLIYIKDRIIDKSIYQTLLRFGFYPVLSISVYSFLQAPFGAYKFSYSSSGFMSAGYSATQTAPAYVFGIIMLLIAIAIGRPIFKKTWHNHFFIGLFLFQALLTFSRGAILILPIALFIASTFSYRIKSIVLFLGNKKTLIYICLLAMVFVVGNLISDAKLYQRYLNRDQEGNRIKEDYTTHRYSIALADLKIFWQNPLAGVGIGEAKYLRGKYGGLPMAASHNEITRILAEHGIIGFFSMFYLLLLFLLHIKSFPNGNIRFIKSFCAIFFLLYIIQGAFRIAFPAFLYSLSFLHVDTE